MWIFRLTPELTHPKFNNYKLNLLSVIKVPKQRRFIKLRLFIIIRIVRVLNHFFSYKVVFYVES